MMPSETPVGEFTVWVGAFSNVMVKPPADKQLVELDPTPAPVGQLDTWRLVPANAPVVPKVTVSAKAAVPISRIAAIIARFISVAPLRSEEHTSELQSLTNL